MDEESNTHARARNQTASRRKTAVGAFFFPRAVEESHVFSCCCAHTLTFPSSLPLRNRCVTTDSCLEFFLRHSMMTGWASWEAGKDEAVPG